MDMVHKDGTTRVMGSDKHSRASSAPSHEAIKRRLQRGVRKHEEDEARRILAKNKVPMSLFFCTRKGPLGEVKIDARRGERMQERPYSSNGMILPSGAIKVVMQIRKQEEDLRH